MGLLERVTTLLRANLNDLIDRAEDPEKLLKQLILDMQNQLLQVKTQVAMAVADQHLLEKRLAEHRKDEVQYLQKAELALEGGREDLARQAAELSLNAGQLAESFTEQLEDQKRQVENLKAALFKLQSKLRDAQAQSDVIRAQHRRARTLDRAVTAGSNFRAGSASFALDRMKDKAEHAEAVAEANAAMQDADILHEELMALGKQERIDQILQEIRRRKGAA